MKTKSLSFLILLCTAVAAYAQPALLNEDNEWYYNVECLITPNCGYAHYSIGQDTLINDLSGRVVYENTLHELSTEPQTEVHILRQSNDTVFRYSPEAELWHMLYDFGAQPGDIWNIQTDTYLGYGSEDWLELFKISVDSIDQIVIGQNTHRVIYTSSWTDGVNPSGNSFGYNGGRIIEGIGPVDQAQGLIGQSTTMSITLQWPSFACFLNNGELIWGSDTSPCNALSVKRVEGDIAELSIFPNPAFDTFQINLPDKSAVLQFYTSDHKLRKIIDLNGRSQQTTIPLDGLAPGFYIIHLLDQDGRAIGYTKFVKL